MAINKFKSIEAAHKWQNYLKRTAALGGSYASDARIVLQLGGTEPCRSKETLESWIKSGRIRPEQYELYKNSIEILEQARIRGKGTCYVDVTSENWVQVRGGHMKKVHIEGEKHD